MVTLNLAQKYQEGKYGKILKRFRVGHIQDDKWLHLDSLFIDQKLKPVLISSYYKIKKHLVLCTVYLYRIYLYVCMIDQKRDLNLEF